MESRFQCDTLGPAMSYVRFVPATTTAGTLADGRRPGSSSGHAPPGVEAKSAARSPRMRAGRSSVERWASGGSSSENRRPKALTPARCSCAADPRGLRWAAGYSCPPTCRTTVLWTWPFRIRPADRSRRWRESPRHIERCGCSAHESKRCSPPRNEAPRPLRPAPALERSKRKKELARLLGVSLFSSRPS